MALQKLVDLKREINCCFAADSCFFIFTIPWFMINDIDWKVSLLLFRHHCFETKVDVCFKLSLKVDATSVSLKYYFILLYFVHVYFKYFDLQEAWSRQQKTYYFASFSKLQSLKVYWSMILCLLIIVLVFRLYYILESCLASLRYNFDFFYHLMMHV